MSPETRIHTLRRFALQGVVGRKVEYDLAVFVFDIRILTRRDEAALGKVEILAVRKRQLLQDLFANRLRRSGRFGGDLPGDLCCSNRCQVFNLRNLEAEERRLGAKTED
jgi:hypothetical protein